MGEIYGESGEGVRACVRARGSQGGFSFVAVAVVAVGGRVFVGEVVRNSWGRVTCRGAQLTASGCRFVVASEAGALQLCMHSVAQTTTTKVRAAAVLAVVVAAQIHLSVTVLDS